MIGVYHYTMKYINVNTVVLVRTCSLYYCYSHWLNVAYNEVINMGLKSKITISMANTRIATINRVNFSSTCSIAFTVIA